MAQLLGKPKAQFLDSNGVPLVGGKVYSYEAGTSTPLVTYTDQGGGTANANPVILDSRGEADIWLDGSAYKIVLADSDDNILWTVDDVKHINSASVVASMLADGAVTTAKIADNAVTRAKLASSLNSSANSSVKTEDYTVVSTDDIILIDAISNDITITLPAVASSGNQVVTLKRVDDTDIQVDTFVDGDVTVGTNDITLTAHPFYNLQRVQLTSTGTLPAGLSLATNYYIIYVDANTVKLASSVANAEIGTAVDITAAAGGGTHTVTSQENTVTIDGNASETIDGSTAKILYDQYDFYKIYCDASEWFVISYKESEKAYAESTTSSGSFSTTSSGETDVTNATVDLKANGNRYVEVSLIQGSTSSVSEIQVSQSSVTAVSAEYRIYRGSTLISSGQLNVGGASGNLAIAVPPGAVRILDLPPRGTHTYKLAVNISSGPTVYATSIKLSAKEI